MTHADPTEQYDRDLEPQLPPSDVWAPTDEAEENNSITLAGPDNPDEGDHQSKLDSLGAPDFEGQSDLRIVHTDLPRVNPDPMPAASKFLFGDSEENIASAQAAAAKREAQRAKLIALGQAALDRIYDEYEFVNDPRFAEINKLIANDPDKMNDGEVADTFKAMQQTGNMVEYITKTLKLPAEREHAVRAYGEYRSMLESL